MGIEQGWIPLSVQILRHYPNELGVRGEVMWDNNQCFANSAEHCSLLADAGFFEEAVKLMREITNIPDPDGSTAHSIDMLGTRRTFNVALTMLGTCGAAHRERFVKADAVDVILEGLKQGITSGEKACVALTALDAGEAGSCVVHYSGSS